MKNVEYRLCKVKIKEGREGVVNDLGMMQTDTWYPAASLNDGVDGEKTYLVSCDHFFMICVGSCVEEQPEFKMKPQHGDIKEIKMRVANIDLFQWWFTDAVKDFEVGEIYADNDTNVPNNVEGSQWREYFNKGQKYLYVRRKGVHEVAVQVRKGAIFYIDAENLEKFTVRHLPAPAEIDEAERYSILKELKYMISNLIK